MIAIHLARDVNRMTLEDVISAIDEAERQIDSSFSKRAVDGIINFTFVAGARTVSEKIFFSQVADRLPNARSALRRLIEKYASDTNNRHLYYEKSRTTALGYAAIHFPSVREVLRRLVKKYPSVAKHYYLYYEKSGTAALGYAALALARLDASAAPVIRSYGALIDLTCESFYTLSILPAFFKTHGWSDAAIELGIIEMLENVSPSFQYYDLIWSDWGMGAAVMAAMTPEDFAARFAARAKSQRSIDFLMMKLGRKFLGPDADLRILGPYADLLDTDLLEHASSRWKVTFLRALERALKLNQTIDIQLARDIDSMALEDVIAAINEAERQIDENFARRAVDEIIYFTFVAGEKRISEKVFFSQVADRFPGAKDALRRLIEKYASDPENTDIYYEPGTVALGHAALALARLDASAGPLIRRYGALIDGEHEGFYPMAILPAFFKTHGWSDAAIELGIIEIERNGSPQFNDYSMIWCDWGMGAAVAAAMTPQDFAARLVSDVQADRCMSEDDMYWFYGFAHKFQREDGDLSKSAPPAWMKAFFAAVQTALPTAELYADPDGLDDEDDDE